MPGRHRPNWSPASTTCGGGSDRSLIATDQIDCHIQDSGGLDSLSADKGTCDSTFNTIPGYSLLLTFQTLDNSMTCPVCPEQPRIITPPGSRSCSRLFLTRLDGDGPAPKKTPVPFSCLFLPQAMHSPRSRWMNRADLPIGLRYLITWTPRAEQLEEILNAYIAVGIQIFATGFGHRQNEQAARAVESTTAGRDKLTEERT